MQPPWIASRLQDFFGMRETPAVARGAPRYSAARASSRSRGLSATSFRSTSMPTVTKKKPMLRLLTVPSSARTWAADAQPLRVAQIDVDEIKATAGRAGAWETFVRMVMSHPLPALVVAVVMLLALGDSCSSNNPIGVQDYGTVTGRVLDATRNRSVDAYSHELCSPGINQYVNRPVVGASTKGVAPGFSPACEFCCGAARST